MAKNNKHEVVFIEMDDLVHTSDNGFTFPFIIGGAEKIITSKREKDPLVIEFYVDGEIKSFKKINLKDLFEDAIDYLGPDKNATIKENKESQERLIRFFTTIRDTADFYLKKSKGEKT